MVKERNNYNYKVVWRNKSGKIKRQKLNEKFFIFLLANQVRQDILDNILKKGLKENLD